MKIALGEKKLFEALPDNGLVNILKHCILLVLTLLVRRYLVSIPYTKGARGAEPNHDVENGILYNFQLAIRKFKVSWVNFVGVRPTPIYYQLKKSLNMLKACSTGVLHGIF